MAGQAAPAQARARQNSCLAWGPSLACRPGELARSRTRPDCLVKLFTSTTEGSLVPLPAWVSADPLARPPALVHSDDTEAEVLPAHAGPAGRAQLIRQLLLARPGPDGLGQVVIGLRVAREAPGDDRQHPGQVLLIQSVEPPPGEVTELTDDDLPARLGYPQQLAERQPSVGHVPQPERNRDRVEGGIREREGERVPGHESECLPWSARADPEHAEREVAGNAARSA